MLSSVLIIIYIKIDCIKLFYNKKLIWYTYIYTYSAVLQCEGRERQRIKSHNFHIDIRILQFFHVTMICLKQIRPFDYHLLYCNSKRNELSNYQLHTNIFSQFLLKISVIEHCWTFSFKSYCKCVITVLRKNYGLIVMSMVQYRIQYSRIQ